MRSLNLFTAVVSAVLTVASISGCASQMALLKGSSKKTIAVQGTLDEAFATASATGKELGYSISEKKAKNFIGASRGMGYAEFSTVYIRFSETAGAVSVAFDANSNKGSEAVLDEYVAAFSKRVKLQ